MSESDEDIGSRAAAALRQELESVPPEVAERLSAMRRQAVLLADTAQTQGFGRWGMGGVAREARTWPALAGAGGVFAAALTLAVMVGGSDQLLQLHDEELWVAQEAELLEELEFIAWVAEMEAEDGLPPRG